MFDRVVGQNKRAIGPEPERPVRKLELQDPLNLYLYHPLAWQLAKRLARTPITPNMVSVSGATCVLAAAFAYAQPYYPWSALFGLLLHMTWHVVDGADGDLARITGKTSPLGELIDGLCDYLSHVVLYLVLGWILAGQIGTAEGWTITVIAGLSHIAQSNHVEVQRRSYQWWVYGTAWLRTTQQPEQSGEIGSALGWIVRAYLALAGSLAPDAPRIDAAVLAAQDDPARLAVIRTAVMQEAGPLLRLLKVLGPNPRALVLGASMLAGTPLHYMLYQTVALNLLLLLSVRLHNRAAQRIVAAIDG